MPTLSQVGMVAFGKKMFNLTNWAIVIGQFGAICAYMIFISTNISEVFGIHRYYILFGAMLPAMLLVMIPDLGKLSMAGIIGNLAYIFAICVIFYLGFSEFCCVDKNEVQLLNVSSLPILFGTLSFALEGTALIFGIRDRMAQPHTFAFNMIFSMAIIAFIYWSVGFVSYILYGVHTKSPIISSLPDGLVLSGVVKITLSLSILLTLPYQFFPITE
jgi:amino acid permease